MADPKDDDKGGGGTGTGSGGGKEDPPADPGSTPPDEPAKPRVRDWRSRNWWRVR